jgi:Lrp/AsnC family leucine-responsive transcriptional regulator
VGDGLPGLASVDELAQGADRGGDLALGERRGQPGVELALGLGLTIFVEIKVEGHSEKLASELEKAVATMPEVVSCHLVSGAADFLLEVVVPDLSSYERLLLGSLLKLPGVSDVRSNFAIRRVKAPSPLPLGHLS